MAFVGTDLERRLRATKRADRRRCRPDHRSLLLDDGAHGFDLGFEVWFLADATATHAREVPCGPRFDPDTAHEAALANLSDEFAEIVDSAVAVRRVQEVHARA